MRLKRDNGAWVVVDFRYERLPTFCFFCGVLGHGDKYCHKVLRGVDPALEMPYGSWLRAGMRRTTTPARRRGEQGPSVGVSSDEGKQIVLPGIPTSRHSICIEQKKQRFGDEDVGMGASASSITCPYSDHLPILLTPKVIVHAPRRKRFCFDNMWLREEVCRKIVEQSWGKTMGLDILERVDVCSQDLGGGDATTIKTSLRGLINAKINWTFFEIRGML
nr:uncharacterized protein LOC109154879 [Ipomoea trifida]